MGLLDNRKIVITGGSMGIGLAVAKKCADEGARLILVSRHKEDLVKAVNQIGGSERGHSFQCLDVRIS